MAFGEDMELRKTGAIDIGNGVIVMAGAAVRKTGLNPTDINFLVRHMAGGDSWTQACKALAASSGAIDSTALAGWRKEIERRVGLHGKPMSVKDLTNMDLVLPAARNEREQCEHITPDLPTEICRCILKVHTIGGHVPGKPRFQQADEAAPARPAVATSKPKARTGKLELATGPKAQCRVVCEEGELEGTRCLLVRHDGDDHVFKQPKVKAAPTKKVVRRSAKAMAPRGGAGAGG